MKNFRSLSRVGSDSCSSVLRCLGSAGEMVLASRVCSNPTLGRDQPCPLGYSIRNQLKDKICFLIANEVSSMIINIVFPFVFKAKSTVCNSLLKKLGSSWETPFWIFYTDNLSLRWHMYVQLITDTFTKLSISFKIKYINILMWQVLYN